MRTRIRPRHIVLPVLATAAFAAPAQAEVESGRNLEINHSNQLGVLEGWDVGDDVLVEVFRGATINPATHAVSGGTLIASHEAAITTANRDQQGGTTYDINHVGPAAAETFGKSDCWDVAGGGTPDVKPGDLVVATVLSGPAGARTADVDYHFVRNVVFDENPATGAITGHARGIENAGSFDVNARIAATGGPEAGGGAMEAKRVGAASDGELLIGDGDIAADGTFRTVPPVVVPGTPGDGELFIDTVDASGGGTGITVALRSSEAAEDTGCGPLRTSALSSTTHDVVNVANAGTPLVVGGPRLSTVAVTLTVNGKPYPVVNDDAAGTWSATISDLATFPDGNLVISAAFSDGGPADVVTLLKDTLAPAAPMATPGAGTYTTPQSVTISGEPGATLHVTTDGSTPTAGSPKVTGPVLVSTSRMLKAIAVDGAGNAGAVRELAYVIEAPAAGGGTAGGGAGSSVTVGGATAGGGTAGGGALGGTVTTTAGTGAGNTTASLTPLSLRRLSTAPRIKRATARRRGIRLTIDVPGATRVLKITVLRRSRGRLHVVSSATRNTARTGRLSITQNGAALRRALRLGSYEVRVTPGRSRSDLGRTAKASFRVVR